MPSARLLQLREGEELYRQMQEAGVVGDRHYKIAQAVRQTLANYEELKDIVVPINFLMMRWCQGSKFGFRKIDCSFWFWLDIYSYGFYLESL